MVKKSSEAKDTKAPEERNEESPPVEGGNESVEASNRAPDESAEKNVKAQCGVQLGRRQRGPHSTVDKNHQSLEDNDTLELSENSNDDDDEEAVLHTIAPSVEEGRQVIHEEVASVAMEQDEEIIEDVDGGMDEPNRREETSIQQEDAFSAYLAPDPDEIRRRMFEEAVVATNVRVVPTKKKKKENKRRILPVVLVVVIALALGISLGVTLRGKNNDSSATSVSPTQAPTSTEFGLVAELVESRVNTTLQDPSTPQYQAAQWMAHEDMVFEDLATIDPDRFLQRYALAVFYFATGGPTSWIETSFFLRPDAHECEWQNTAVPNTQSYSGYVGVYNCSSEGWVERIEINQNNLTGTLPEELGSLPFLAELTVFMNSIGGTLPTSLFGLSNLQILDIWANEFTGTIPTEVGRATSLLLLVLPYNSLTGTVPKEIESLFNLDEIGLDTNFLTGSIPDSLRKVSTLEKVQLADNIFTGTLPPSIWSSWPNLLEFGVRHNLLSGSIPNNLELVPRLEGMVLQQNNFTGPFPSSIVALTNVTHFFADRNAFTGSLPNNWSNLSSTLEWFQIADNRLSGTLPESLGSLTKLEELHLLTNKFSGTLPASWGNNLTKLLALQVQDNRLTGSVPESFIRLSLLNRLKLHHNKLTGDLSFLCNGTDELFPFLRDFSSDCLGEFQEVVCPCCTECCNINDTCSEL